MVAPSIGHFLRQLMHRTWRGWVPYWRGGGAVHMPRWKQTSTTRWLCVCLSSFNNTSLRQNSHWCWSRGSRHPLPRACGKSRQRSFRCEQFWRRWRGRLGLRRGRWSGRRRVWALEIFRSQDRGRFRHSRWPRRKRCRSEVKKVLPSQWWITKATFNKAIYHCWPIYLWGARYQSSRRIWRLVSA